MNPAPGAPVAGVAPGFRLCPFIGRRIDRSAELLIKAHAVSSVVSLSTTMIFPVIVWCPMPQNSLHMTVYSRASPVGVIVSTWS